MSESTETIVISKCPRCSGSHEYRLEVRRALVVAMMTPSLLEESARRRRFTRLFTCPEKDKVFQATIFLEETSLDQIEDVAVVD